MKLIVTGHDESGKAVFAFAGPPPREPHPGSFELWTTRGPVVVPDATDPHDPPRIGYFPAEGETSFKIVTVPGRAARTGSSPNGGGMNADLASHFDADDPEMHTTDTIDYVIILSGTADLELDDGRREAVGPGDCIVQRGTRHAWRVTSADPLILAGILLGARRSP